jgi:hypothetical protein
MGAPFYASWPLWVRVLVFVPPLFTFTVLSLGAGVWPGNNRRAWRTFGVLLVGFTAFCWVMFCGFHYSYTFSLFGIPIPSSYR